MSWQRTATAAAALSVTTALASCATSSGLHTSNPLKTRAAIEGAIPVGATAETAWKTMTKAGYTCRYTLRVNINCRLSANLPGDVFSTVWIARFSLVDGRVTRVNTGQGMMEL